MSVLDASRKVRRLIPRGKRADRSRPEIARLVDNTGVLASPSSKTIQHVLIENKATERIAVSSPSKTIQHKVSDASIQRHESKRETREGNDASTRRKRKKHELEVSDASTQTVKHKRHKP